MSEPLLELSHIHIAYGRFYAVQDVSFSLRPGDLLGMIGPNGAGKSSTLRAAAGLQPVLSGSVRILGHDVFQAPTVVGNHLGFAPDTPQVYDSLTVEGFLQFIARCYCIPSGLATERIDYWLGQLWLTEKKTAKVSALSRGMRQRLAVARTLLPDPHVILLDEPAAGLDPAGRVQFRQLLASLRDQGKAVIVSSHILADLAEYCTHIAIMGGGRVLQYGTVGEVASGAARNFVQFRITLAQRVGDLATRLALVNGFEFGPADGDVFTVDVPPERGAAADLLRQLLAAGLPVAEFRALEPSLEQAYLRAGVGQVD